MTQSSTKPSVTNTITRCQHRNRTGRQCKLLSVSGSPLCYSHNQATRKESAAELASAILGGRSQFASASDINQTLSQILVAAVQKRLSTREATAFAYICSLLLRSTAILSQEKRQVGSSTEEPESLFDSFDSSWMPAVARRAREWRNQQLPKQSPTETRVPVSPVGTLAQITTGAPVGSQE